MVVINLAGEIVLALTGETAPFPPGGVAELELEP